MFLNRSTHPVIIPDKAWEEGGSLSAVAVVPDEEANELRLYYMTRFRENPVKNILCLARSSDGHTWSKQDVGDGTNIVMRSSGHPPAWGMFMPTTVLRDEQESDPTQRWKMVYWDRPDESGPAGICLAVSVDGIRWNPLFQRPIITNANDAMSMIDAIPGVPTPLSSGSYFIYQQTWKYNPNLPTARDNLKGIHRRISIWTSRQFSNGWVGPVAILEPDEQDDRDLQFYGLAPFKTGDGTYGGLINCHHTEDQTMDVQLVSSRDGWSWSRENGRKPILARGEQGRFDCGMITVAARPVQWLGKTLVFYNGRSTVHDGQPHDPLSPPPSPANGIGRAEFTDELMGMGPVSE